jgi:glycosyltransferase involved in cell wall biosynthesis
MNPEQASRVVVPRTAIVQDPPGSGLQGRLPIANLRPQRTSMPTNARLPLVAIGLAGCDFGKSGIGEFARAILPRLAAFLASNDTPSVVIGTRRERTSLGVENLPALRLPSPLNLPSVSGAFSLLALPAVARWVGARVLYLPAANRRVVGWPLIPTTGTVHDLAQFRVPNKYGRARQIYVQHVLTPLLRKLTMITTVSQATADDVVLFAGVPRSRIRVIPNGVSVNLALSARRPHPRPYLLYPARLEHPGKNHVRLLHAFARSKASHDHDLVLAGADWGAAGLVRDTIELLGLQHRVLWLGFISRADLDQWIQCADGVLAAGLLEGFGMQAAEGLAAGRPVAVSSTGALPEVVGDLGVLFDPNDEESITQGLDRLIADPAVRQRCLSLGPARAQRFSWDSAAEAIGRLLLEAAHAAA